MITDRFFAVAAAAALVGVGLGSTPASAQTSAPAQMARSAYQQIWTDASGRPTDAALVLVEFLRRADEHALPVSKYRGDELAGRLRNGGAGLEGQLTEAFLAYADDLHSGVLNPANVDKDLHVEVSRLDPQALLKAAAEAPNMAAFLDGLAPRDPLYRRLVERYRAFRSVAGDEIWGPRVGGGGALRLGDRNSRVAQARARLTAMGDLDPNIYGRPAAIDGVQIAALGGSDALGYDPEYFDKGLQDALMRFQARHGLIQDGLIGPATRTQLNISARERAEQIAVNLERQRWLNGKLTDRYLLVNTAGFEMWVMENGRPVLSSRVINGQADGWETSEFVEELDHLIVNPTWEVPMAIATQKMLPQLKKDPNYLAQRGMRLVGANAEEVNWANVTPENFPGRITQLPGEGNVLGNIKFMFPNPYGIYLHDTPGKHLFEEDVRAFSHGCVRVEKARELVEYLLKGQVRNPAAYYDDLVASGEQTQVNLERPIPVVLTYRTAWIDENGNDQFRGDVYGRDNPIARALQSAGVRVLN